jgi:O-antigen ligase
VGAALLAASTAATGTVIAILGLLQIVFRPGDMVFATNISPPQHFVRAVYGNENNLALLIDRALPMALALAIFPGWVLLFSCGRHWSLRGIAVRAVQTTLVLCSLLMAYILYRTGSRGGEAATGLCVAILYVVWQWRNRVALAGGGAVIVAAAFLARHRISSFVNGSHGLSNGAHTSVWRSALRMIHDHPIFGVGPDNFLYYYSNDASCAPGHIKNYYYSQDNQTNFERCISHPHNMFLDFWLSTGILGLASAVVLIGLFAVLGILAFKAADTSWKGPILGALVAMVAFVAHGEVDNSYFLPDIAVFFWLCLGIVTLWWQRENSADVTPHG